MRGSRVLPSGVSRSVLWIAVTLLSLLPPLLALAHVHAYAVSYVLVDSFDFVPMFDKFEQGTLTFQDFYAQHNEHRILFPRLAMLGLGLLTRYDVRAEAYLGWGLLVLGAVPLLLFCRRSRPDRLRAAIAFAPAAWLLFSLRQSWNLLWGWQTLYWMALAFFLLSAYLVESASGLDSRLVGGALCGLVASFSLCCMLLVWPIGLVMIHLRERRETSRTGGRALLFWSGAGILVWCAYFVGYSKPAHHPSLLFGARHAGDAFRFLCRYLANPLGAPRTFLGAMLLVSYLAAVIASCREYRRGLPVLGFPLALLLLALGTAGLTTLSRLGLGLEQAIEPRYQTLSGLGLLGLYTTFLRRPPLLRLRVGSRDLTGAIGISALILIIVPAYARSSREGESRRALGLKFAYDVSTYPLQSDRTLREVHPDPLYARQRAEILRRLQLNVFADPPLDPRSMTTADEKDLFCVVDRILDAPAPETRSVFVARDIDTIEISGWALDREAMAPAGAVFIEVDGRIQVPSAMGFPRPEVARGLGEPRFRYSGFAVTFRADLLEQGRHVLRFAVVSADRRRIAFASEPWVLAVEGRGPAARTLNCPAFW